MPEETTSLRRFTTTLSVRGASVAVLVPFDPDAVWGQKERHDATGTVGGCKVRGPLQQDRDGFVLVLGPAWLRDSKIDLSATVEVTLAPEGPQLDNLCPDFRDALLANPEARTFFESIPTFYRKNYVRWIEDARRPETRTKRIAETVTLLSQRVRQR